MKIESHPDGVRIRLKVVPGSSRDSIAGWLGDRLKVRVCAAPEGGQANEAVRHLLAETLGVHARQIAIIAGQGSPEKTLRIAGLNSKQVAARLPS